MPIELVNLRSKRRYVSMLLFHVAAMYINSIQAFFRLDSWCKFYAVRNTREIKESAKSLTWNRPIGSYSIPSKCTIEVKSLARNVSQFYQKCKLKIGDQRAGNIHDFECDFLRIRRWHKQIFYCEMFAQILNDNNQLIHTHTSNDQWSKNRSLASNCSTHSTHIRPEYTPKMHTQKLHGEKHNEINMIIIKRFLVFLVVCRLNMRARAFNLHGTLTHFVPFWFGCRGCCFRGILCLWANPKHKNNTPSTLIACMHAWNLCGVFCIRHSVQFPFCVWVFFHFVKNQNKIPMQIPSIVQWLCHFRATLWTK